MHYIKSHYIKSLIHRALLRSHILRTFCFYAPIAGLDSGDGPQKVVPRQNLRRQHSLVLCDQGQDDRLKALLQQLLEGQRLTQLPKGLKIQCSSEFIILYMMI